MTKNELKKYLMLYSKISKFAEENHSVCVIKRWGRKQKIDIPEWVDKLPEIFEIIESENNFLLTSVIEKAYKKGINDRVIITELPVTESGYYRLKRKIEDKIYQLLILYNCVSEEDILNNKIIDW